MKNNKPYPTKKVIFAYGLIAPLIGSLLLFFVLFVIAMINGQNINDYGFSLLIVFFIIATFIAVIPAFIAGIWIANTKTYICDKKDYLKIFNKGVMSCIFFLIISITHSIFSDLVIGLPTQDLQNKIDDNVSKEYLGMMLFSLIGGVSSVITGKLFLPKSPKGFEK